MDDYNGFQSTFFYDRTGQLLYELFNEGRRTKVSLRRIPGDLINATVAIEDDSFWTNPGFELQATARAFLQYSAAQATAPAAARSRSSWSVTSCSTTNIAPSAARSAKPKKSCWRCC